MAVDVVVPKRLKIYPYPRCPGGMSNKSFGGSGPGGMERNEERHGHKKSSVRYVVLRSVVCFLLVSILVRPYYYIPCCIAISYNTRFRMVSTCMLLHCVGMLFIPWCCVATCCLALSDALVSRNVFCSAILLACRFILVHRSTHTHKYTRLSTLACYIYIYI